MNILESTEHFYVKCIKPNNNKRPDEFDPLEIMRQLHVKLIFS
jgi:myosin heavy subunit